MKWNNFNASVGVKAICVLLLSIVSVFCFDVEGALAHGPHDVVIDVELSPEYQRDQTAYYLLDSYLPIWGNLFKSEDGGESWHRIEKTLDNQHKLSSLAVSARAKEILFLSTLGDGIYKSETGGDSWRKVNQGLATLSIDSVVTAPDSAEFVLAAGTESGLYETENGGAHWKQVMSEAKISAIAFAPENESIIVGDARSNLYASDDRGQSWQQLYNLENSGAIQAIAISPRYQTDRTVWVGTEKAGIWQTQDGGVTFSPVNRGIGDRTIMALAISPDYETDGTLLASTWHEGIFRSTDGGKTWQKHSRGLKKTSQADTELYKSPHFSNLSISQTYSRDGTVFVAGFDGLFKSTNGGRSWRDVNIGKGATSLRNLAISPNYQNDSTIAISTLYQGVYLSQDSGTTWSSINRGLGLDRLLKQNLITQTGDLVFSPNYSSDNTLLASSWGCLFKSTNGGKQWQKHWVPKRLRRDSYMAVSPNFGSDRTIYLVTLPGKILQSTDDGENFSVAGEVDARAAFIPSLILSPNFASDRTLYLGNYTGGVYKSVDGGATWQLANKGLIAKDDYAKLTISPNYQRDRTVFAGTAEGLFVTQDGGSSWRKFTNTAYGDNSYIETIAVSPNYQSDRTFLISVRGKGLFRTVDGGTTFTQIGDYLTGPIEFSPSYQRDRTIYSSSGAELYKTTDGGDTWQTLVVPKPNYNFLTILYHVATNSPARRYLTAAMAALLVYLLIGYLRLGKKWSLRKWQLKTSGAAFTTFVGILIILSV
ncbi:WD40/YVTN/BNR-like repeat-containing protein [Myxosarcina sp. GI1(2024)]